VQIGCKKAVKITIANKIYLSDIPEQTRFAIMERLMFENPKWVELERLGKWTGSTPKVLTFYEETENGGLIIPRGFVGQLLRLCRKRNVRYQLDDRRRTLPEMDFSFTGKLKTFQQEAVKAMLVKDFGTLSAPTGSGKTVMALCMIAQRKQPALIVVHTKELLNQWIDRIESFMDIPVKEIGVIGNGKKSVGDRITVALVQSLYKCADNVSKHIGHLVVDECHRAPARTFTEAVSAFDSRYMLGLSATPWRRDKLSKLIFWHIGDVHHTVDKADLIETGDILKAEVITRETDFRPYSDPTNEYSTMLSELTEDPKRNHLIASDVAQEAGNGGGICLVLSDRKGHCEKLQAILSQSFSISSELLTGDIPNKQRQGVVDSLNAGKVKVLIATGQLIGEGFDCRDLTTLFLATPIKFDGRLLQYLGRVLRPAPGKDKAMVFDYIDPVGVLKAAARSRQRAYDCQPVNQVVNHG